MRQVNDSVVRENYQLPDVDAVITSIPPIKMVSKIDLKQAYFHFELEPESRDLTTFITRSGAYRFRRLMFGLKSAPEAFQKSMDNLFRGIKNTIIYMDDILVYGQTVTEHDEALTSVLNKINELKIRINEEKSEYRKREVTFLGYIISEEGVRATNERVQAILDLLSPKSTSELRSLIGMFNFLSRFIPHLAGKTKLWRDLVKKGSQFTWTDEHQSILDELKGIVAKQENLGCYDPNDKTYLITDASPFGLGAILVQEKNNKMRVICYISKSLAAHELKYCQTEKECFAIVWSMERLYKYLYGLKFILYTDCKALEYLFKPRSKPSARIERWILRLQSFDFEVKYQPGEGNVADPLSRLLTRNHDDTSVEIIGNIVDYSRPSGISIEDIERATINDVELQRVKEALKSELNESWEQVAKEYKNASVRPELMIFGEMILRGDRIVVPAELRDEMIQLAHKGHLGSTSMKILLRSRVWFPGMDKRIEEVVSKCKECKRTDIPEKPTLMTRRRPTRPWQDIALDFKESLPDGQTLLVAVCYTSRFIQIEAMRPATSQRVILALLKMFMTLGKPASITADNGPQFRSLEFQSFCKAYGIHLNLSTPYWPQENGAVERQMENLKKRLQISVMNETDYVTDLYEYLLMYHSTPQEATGISPGKMMFNRELNNGIPSIKFNNDNLTEEYKDKDMIYKEKKKEQMDKKRNAKQNTLKIGDTVLKKNIEKGALIPNFGEEEFKIVEMKGSKVSAESIQTGKLVTRNQTHFKKLNTEEDSGRNNGKEIEEPEEEVVHTESGEQEMRGKEEIHEVPTESKDQDQKRQRKMNTKYKDFLLY